MITANACSLQYKDGTLALKPFDLAINKGEVVFITGPSGSGKTSLLKLILGMEFPTSGAFTVLNQPIKAGCDREIRQMRTQIGPIFQEFRLLDGRSVLDNVMLSMRFLGYSQTQMRELATHYIDRVGLSHKLEHTVDRLSWGECQRVAIARAVVRKPKLIVADEPTGNLDQENAKNVLALLMSFCDDETSVIITTHATHLVDHMDAHVRLKMQNGTFVLERGLSHGER